MYNTPPNLAFSTLPPRRIHLGVLLYLSLLFALSGCAGTQSYPNKVLAGETVTIGAGWKHNFSRNDVTVRFIPEVGPEVVYLPGDPAVRAILNLYPDPLSGMVVSQQTGANINGGSKAHGDVINWNYTEGDNDWWQTTVFVDVPSTLPNGVTEVEISNQVGDTATSLVEIIGSGGMPDDFMAESLGGITSFYFNSLERLDHYVVSISSTVVPAAIQIDLEATDFSGYVTQGRGEAVSLNWAYDNGIFRVLMSPTTNGSTKKVQDFKIYIVITSGLASTAALDLIGEVEAFDENGDLINGVSASIQLERGIYGLFDI